MRRHIEESGSRALGLAVRAGDLLLSAGMSANDVVVRMRQIARAYGLSALHIDVTYTAISASFQPSPDVPPVTFTRIVRPGQADYTQARRLLGLCSEIQRGMPLPQAMEAFEGIWSASRPYHSWLATTGHAGVGAAAVLLFTTAWQNVSATFVIGCLVDRMLDGLQRRKVPPFFQLLAGAVVITVIAAAATAARSHRLAFFAGVNPALIVDGGIIMLVAGIVIVGAVQDAIDQFYITASARLLEVAMRTAAIVFGIVIVVHAALRLGVPLSISASPVGLGPLVAQFAGAAATAAFFALYVYSDGVTIGLAAVVAAIGWAAHAAMSHADTGEVAASTVAALVAAIAATLMTRRNSVPGFGLVRAAILPLVPGLALYDGLLLVVGSTAHGAGAARGVATLLIGLGVALGIAAGASLGTYIGRPIVDRATRTWTRLGRVLQTAIGKTFQPALVADGVSTLSGTARW